MLMSKSIDKSSFLSLNTHTTETATWPFLCRGEQ